MPFINNNIPSEINTEPLFLEAGKIASSWRIDWLTLSATDVW